MKIISKFIWLLVFIAFLGFALKNDKIVTLEYFWGYQQSAPLVILFRHRRDISRHKKTIAEIEKERQLEQAAANQAPTPDAIPNVIRNS
jgi:putative membrane protein